MCKFALKLLTFLIPAAVFLAFPLLVFVLSKEYYSIDDVLRAQKEDPAVIEGLAYTNFPGYKNALVAEKDPQVFALGTSRVGQFRKEFFTEDAVFVTASNSVRNIEGMKEFIEKLPKGNTTKIVIFGLDPEMFFPSPPPSYSAPENDFIGPELFLARWRNVYSDFTDGKFSFRDLWEKTRATNNIGMNAIFNGYGFRADGSYQYLKDLEGPDRLKVLKESADVSVSTIRAERGFVPYNSPVLQTATSSLDDLLALCQEKNIYAIGIIPPYMPAVYGEMVRVHDALYFARIKDFPAGLEKIFSDRGFAFYDFSDSTVLGGKNTEFVDPFHGTDKMYLRMVIYLAEKNKNLAEYVDIPAGEKLLQSTKKDFFGPVISTPNNSTKQK